MYSMYMQYVLTYACTVCMYMCMYICVVAVVWLEHHRVSKCQKVNI